MASTDQVRQWYPELVTNHAKRGTAGFTPKCDTSKGERVAFPAQGGGTYYLLVNPKTVEAFKAYAALMRAFGETVPSAGGTHNCRNISGSNSPSLHAYAVAIDLPPNSRKSAAFQTAVLRMKTKSGVRVWKNLASIDDRMHDQIDCSPADLATGIDWSTVGEEMAADHKHNPAPSDLPRSWADGAWQMWVERSGTNNDTRTQDFYREDMSWVYTRVIRPLEGELSTQADEIRDLESRVAQLEKALASLPSQPTAGVYGTVVKLTKP